MAGYDGDLPESIKAQSDVQQEDLPGALPFVSWRYLRYGVAKARFGRVFSPETPKISLSTRVNPSTMPTSSGVLPKVSPGFAST